MTLETQFGHILDAAKPDELDALAGVALKSGFEIRLFRRAVSRGAALPEILRFRFLRVLQVRFTRGTR